jgi:hypothetical protein
VPCTHPGYTSHSLHEEPFHPAEQLHTQTDSLTIIMITINDDDDDDDDKDGKILKMRIIECTEKDADLCV